MIIHDIYSEDSGSRNTAQSKLSILIGMDSFGYTLQYAESGLYGFRHQQWSGPPATVLPKMTQALQQDNRLAEHYAGVAIGFHGPRYTAIPNRLYRAGEERTYLEHLTRVAPSDTVRTDYLPGVGAHLTYLIPQPWQAVLQRLFPQGEVRHLSTLFINYLSNRYFSGSGQQVFLHLDGGQVYLLYFREGQLIFHNSFFTPTAKDVLYFVLLTFEQFDIDQVSTPVHLSGAAETADERVGLLQRYLGQLVLQKMPYTLALAEPLRQLPPHIYYLHALNLL